MAITEAQLQGAASGKGNGWSGEARELARSVLALRAQLDEARKALEEIATDGDEACARFARAALAKIGGTP